MSKIILGLGCDRSTSFETLSEAVALALSEVPHTRGDILALATIDKKQDEACILELSELGGWPIYYFTAEELKVVEVPNPSAVVMKFMGTPAVSEAAAMLAGKVGLENLILEKFKYKGADTKNATVSIVITDK